MIGSYTLTGENFVLSVGDDAWICINISSGIISSSSRPNQISLDHWFAIVNRAIHVAKKLLPLSIDSE